MAEFDLCILVARGESCFGRGDQIDRTRVARILPAECWSTNWLRNHSSVGRVQ